jgi:hypothetical protein
MPDVVPHGGKLLRSVSPPASRGDVSSPFDIGVMRTVVVIFTTYLLFPALERLTTNSFKINENERSLILTLSHCQYIYEYQI